MTRGAYITTLSSLAGSGAVAVSVAARDCRAANGFDHLTTGYELRGAHRDLSCEYCHAKGVFKGTPRTCAGLSQPRKPHQCHSQAGKTHRKR